MATGAGVGAGICSARQQILKSAVAMVGVPGAYARQHRHRATRRSRRRGYPSSTSSEPARGRRYTAPRSTKNQTQTRLQTQSQNPSQNLTGCRRLNGWRRNGRRRLQSDEQKHTKPLLQHEVKTTFAVRFAAFWVMLIRVRPSCWTRYRLISLVRPDYN